MGARYGKVVNISMTQEQYDVISAEADRRGLTMSAFMRSCAYLETKRAHKLEQLELKSIMRVLEDERKKREENA
jgi:uncharacterized protein (DUF1778 family)